MNKTIISIFVMVFLLVSTASAYSVSGQVTGSGVGTLENATVTAYNYTNGVQIDNASTDASGNYVLTVPDVTAPYKFNATYPGFKTANKQTLISGDESGFNFVLGPQSSVNITGRVYNSIGGIVVGATVRAEQSGATIDSTTADGSGDYVLNVLNDTTYNVIGSKSGFVSDTQNIDVDGNEVVNLILTPMSTNGTVQGRVTNTTGAALVNATVRILSFGVFVNTDSNGDYSITYNQGDYNLTASLAGYNDKTQAITINGGQTTNTNFTLLAQGATCTPNWQCTSWSSCSGGSQSRTCSDTNTCGTIAGRPPLTQSCGGSGGSSGSSNDDDIVVSLTPQIKYPDFFEYNPIQYILNRMDTVAFYENDIKYTLMITDIQDDTATFKLFPTYDEYKAEQGEIIEFALGEEDTLKVTLLDATVNSASFDASTVTVNLLLNAEEEEPIDDYDEPVVQKVKDAIVKVVGTIVPEDMNPSVAVGISISASTVILGLLIFFIVRRVTG